MALDKNLSPEELTDLAIQEALGKLAPSDLALVTVAQDAEFAAAVREYQEVFSLLALDTEMPAPSDNVLKSLLAAVAPVAAKPSHFDVFSSESGWTYIFKGVKAKALFVEPTNGYVTSLLKLEPGASLPNHFHKGNEQCMILEGEFQMYGKIFRPGDFTVALAQTEHEGIFTETGALVMLVAPPDYDGAGV